MKRLIITYDQIKPGEIDKNSFDFPMPPEIAACILEGNPVEVLDNLLNALVALIGFDSVEFRSVKEAD